MVIYLPVCSPSLSFSQPETSPDLSGSLGHFWLPALFLSQPLLPVTFRLETFRLTAPTVLCAGIGLIWCSARVGVFVWDLFSK